MPRRFWATKVAAASAVAVLASATVARTQPPLSVSALLPPDGVMFDVMEPSFPKRLEELAVILQGALAKDQAWAQSFISKAKPGEPLPYDTKLGLTKSEYEEFLTLSRSAGLAKVASSTLRVERNGDLAVLLFGTRLQGMERIEIDLARDSVSTPAGVLANRQGIRASSDQAATGPWDGVQWTANASGEDSTRPSVSLALGRLQMTGRGILYYRVRPAASSAVGAVQYLLFYDLQ